MAAPRLDKIDRNLFINSNFEIWQRGISFVAGNNQVYNADRFEYAGGTLTGDFSIDRIAVSGTNAEIVPPECRYASRITVTTAQAVLAAGSSAAPWIKVEGYDIVPIRRAGVDGFTVSFYVKSNLTGQYTVQAVNGSYTRSYVTTYNIDAANTWQRVVLFFPELDLVGPWNYENGIGMYVRFWLVGGSTLQGASANVWQSAAEPQIPSGQVNLLGTLANYWEITGTMLYPGQYEREWSFAGRNQAEELQLCQRYYEKSYDINTAPGAITSNGATIQASINASGQLRMTAHYKVRKRVSSHVFTCYSSATGLANKVRDANGGIDRDQVVDNTGEMSSNISADGATANQTGIAHWTANAEL